jgi:hypothetical protein
MTVTMKIDRQGFLALALGLNAVGCYVSSPPPTYMGPPGRPPAASAPAPAVEAASGPTQECVGWTPAGECNLWEPLQGYQPTQECVGWTPAGECNQWQPADECVGWTPAGECNRWESNDGH